MGFKFNPFTGNFDFVNDAEAGVSDHGALTGLTDDDHAQYLTEQRHDTLANDNPHGVTATQVGLGNVDNTSDADKPVSTAQQTAIDVIGDKYVRTTRFEQISSGTSGSITLTGDQEIILDDFGGTTDAIVTGISGGRPTFTSVQDSSGDDIAATLDASGNWTLVGTPASYPVALIYRLRDKISNHDDSDLSIIGGIDLQGGDVTLDEVGSVAAGSVLGLQQQLLSDAGQPGKTVLAVGYTTSGKVQGVSLGAGNVVEVYASGADFNTGTVLHREFMSFGEPICFTGLSNGAIITSTQGFYGFSEQVDGGDESPMPLLSYGLSFTFTFFFGFRNCQTYDPGGTSTNQGWVHVVNGPLASTVKLTDGSGVTVQGQENISLAAWEYRRLYTSGNNEYIIESTNPVMACHNANMDLNPHGRFYDSRLIMPLTNDGITWPRSGFISAPFNNTQVDFWVRDAAEGRINSTAGTGVSPGSPIDFDAAIGVGTGASDQDYEPNGATRVKAIGLVSAYSGADSAGLEASPLMPTSAMSQIVAQPLYIADNGDGGNSGVAIASPYVGTAKVYSWNDTTSSLDLEYTVPLDRNGVTVTTKEDQNHPAAGMVANETASGAVTLVGQLDAGVVIADVPITVVVQNGLSTLVPTLRSQNGTTTTSIVNDDDETLSLGITPTDIAVEIREDEDGVLRKRVIDNTGTETWVVA